MQTAPTVPAEPVAAEPVLPAPDTTELRVTEQVSLDDAQPQGEPEAQETPPVERRPTRHDDQMVEIVARRRERIEAERAEAKAQGYPDQEPTPPASPAPVETPPRPEVQAPPPGDPAQPPAPMRTHKILVRGNEISMSEDDMRRAAELGVESEARMRHANAVLQEARRVAAASGQPIPGAGPSLPAAPPQPLPQEPSDADRDARRELVRELLYGDEEKVSNALDRVLRSQQPTQPAVDPDMMAREVYSRIDARLGLQNALQTFGSEYPDIVNDPDLATLGANYVHQLRGHYAQTRTPRTELDLFREAGGLVRQALGRWSGNGPAPQPAAAPPAPQPVGNGRLAIKRSMPQAPAAAAAQQMTPAPQAKTGTDIVNEMRRARGQPVYT